jgi:hypothetical protein
MWVRKDLVQKKVFLQADCFPVGREIANSKENQLLKRSVE